MQALVRYLMSHLLNWILSGSLLTFGGYLYFKAYEEIRFVTNEADKTHIVRMHNGGGQRTAIRIAWRCSSATRLTYHGIRLPPSDQTRELSLMIPLRDKNEERRSWDFGNGINFSLNSGEEVSFNLAHPPFVPIDKGELVFSSAEGNITPGWAFFWRWLFRIVTISFLATIIFVGKNCWVVYRKFQKQQELCKSCLSRNEKTSKKAQRVFFLAYEKDLQALILRLKCVDRNRSYEKTFQLIVVAVWQEGQSSTEDIWSIIIKKTLDVCKS